MGNSISPQVQPRWLHARAAARYAALGQKRLKRLAQEGVITGAPDPDSGRGDWVFDRLSLDRYREGQMGAPYLAALEIKGRLGI